MKPIIVFEFDEQSYSPEKEIEFDSYLEKLPLRKEYDLLVMWGGKAKVYYPCKSLKFYYHKLRIWLTRKTLKNNIY